MHLGLFAPLHLVDFVKIDRNWIVHALDSSAHRTTVEGLIDFGRRLDVQIIAEGVETQAHLDLVRELGVEFYQGFIDGEPQLVSEAQPTPKEEVSDYSRTA
jgi:EAL domain-containing protein (putative c-di-GMP-specific phosphodiesterase class I)